VTTPETMQVVRMVLVGQVNSDVVGALNAHGPFAVGLSGEDAHLLTAEKRMPLVDGVPVDVGLVETWSRCGRNRLIALLDAGQIPVIATVARGEDGEIYNVTPTPPPLRSRLLWAPRSSSS